MPSAGASHRSFYPSTAAGLPEPSMCSDQSTPGRPRVRFSEDLLISSPQDCSETGYKSPPNHPSPVIPQALYDPSAPHGYYPESPYGHHTRDPQFRRSIQLAEREVSRVPTQAVVEMHTDIGGRDREGSEDTLYEKGGEDPKHKYSLSSYRHPYDIPPPTHAYTGQPAVAAPPTRRAVRFNDEKGNIVRPGDRDEEHSFGDTFKSHAYAGDGSRPPQCDFKRAEAHELSSLLPFLAFLDDSDPLLTGVRKDKLRELERDEKNRVSLMSYRERRKYLQRARIEFNVTTIENRRRFLVTLVKALVKFCAPSHRMEAQLLSASRILEIECRLLQLPTTMMMCFGQDGDPTAEVHVVVRKGQLQLGSLHRVHQVYRAVVHDEISAKEGIKRLNVILTDKPLYNLPIRYALSFGLAALICPLAFGGSFVDMWVAGSGALFLCLVQTQISSRSHVIYANVYE
ncbi:uncharacterized protein FIBRA_04891 [Fibroporia radiculosa]|uniref:Threonine/serine exporter-like N-terminal domain-containing protein n=1 Tax=Fibroporia radiculosa TaxID=599839 RepID=J4HWS7_9APHY|nr:uncharacterized protein FIBRA_04891 [Fibroporia radiculosa]CCM02782.1 predicted protein [Fibroporia radiculosa]